MEFWERIAEVLAPHLGEHSADAVGRHICAKYKIDEAATPEQLARLRDFLRRGLVVYVGADAARELAERCVETVAQPAERLPR